MTRNRGRQGMNNFAILQALAFEPRRAFAELDARPRFWWPLLLVALASGAVAAWYTSFVDLEWLTDQQLRNSSFTQNMTEAEIERMGRAAAGRRGTQVVIGGLSTTIAIGVVVLLSALYYSLAGKITGLERSFRHWMAMSAWTAIPTLLALLAAAVVLLTASSNQIGQEALQPLSLNALLFHREPDEPGYSLFNAINLLQFVSLYLAAVGVKLWSGRGWLYAILFTALPLVLVYGIWAFFSLR